jgi:hypothetical protein
MCAPQEQFKFKFTEIVDNPYDKKEEDIQTHHQVADTVQTVQK